MNDLSIKIYTISVRNVWFSGKNETANTFNREGRGPQLGFLLFFPKW